MMPSSRSTGYLVAILFGLVINMPVLGGLLTISHGVDWQPHPLFWLALSGVLGGACGFLGARLALWLEGNDR
jgi:H+/Cl- antiporter ClcA